MNQIDRNFIILTEEEEETPTERHHEIWHFIVCHFGVHDADSGEQTTILSKFCTKFKFASHQVSKHWDNDDDNYTSATNHLLSISSSSSCGLPGLLCIRLAVRKVLEIAVSEPKFRFHFEICLVRANTQLLECRSF